MSWYIARTYLAGWVVVLYIFRLWYKYKKSKHENLPPWFAENAAKKEYLELLKSDPENTKELQMALMKRGMVAISMLWTLSEEKNALSRLTQTGAVSDEAWVRLQKAEKELQLEAHEIECEAEELKEGWGRTIMESCTQLVMIQRQRETSEKQKAFLEEMEAEERRQSINNRLVDVTSTEDLTLEEKAKIAERNAKQLIAEEERKRKAAAKPTKAK